MEGDNYLYQDLTADAVPALISNYKSLAATQLSGTFVTASVFWVGGMESLDAFNSWLLALSNETGPGEYGSDFCHSHYNRPYTLIFNHAPLSQEFHDYLEWIRPKACCLSQARGGIYPDKDGNGIRPHAVNEMSMLSFYAEVHKKDKKLELLPLLPGRDEGLIMKKNNLVEYAVGGNMVGGYAGAGVYDPGSLASNSRQNHTLLTYFLSFLLTIGSYGQYLGGTPAKHGQNKKFIDFYHILGQGMIKSACFPHFLCGPALKKVVPSNSSDSQVLMISFQCQ